MRTLRTHTQRELELLELEGALAVENLEADDVLDEATLRAWGAFDERPRNLPLDLWLTSLVHGVLDDYTKEPLLESLQAEHDVSLPEQDEQTSAITWIKQATYPETVELGDLLPGEPGVDSWDRLDFDTKQTKLAELLSYLSRDHRQILVLNAVEGFEPEQIAALQQRSLEEVQADLKESRRRLSAALRNLERKTV
jgi:DNA-directed RNA polymerase specialized sigma24 family protein